MKHQRKTSYLDNTKNNPSKQTSDPEYNNKNNTDMSVGATGRDISDLQS
ncbi:hypothetical protein [Bacillus massilinigeriensis]|nr:hypothetical protein [Bacillus massilionigeriensis]